MFHKAWLAVPRIILFIYLEQVFYRGCSLSQCNPTGLCPGVKVYLTLVEIILHLKNVHFNSDTIVYMVQGLEKNLYYLQS